MNHPLQRGLSFALALASPLFIGGAALAQPESAKHVATCAVSSEPAAAAYHNAIPTSAITTSYSAIDTSILEYVIAEAERQMADPGYNNVIPNVQRKMRESLAAAKTVLDAAQKVPPSTTQSEVDQVFSNLLETLQYLSFTRGDKTALIALETECSALNAHDYLPASWPPFLTALADARQVIADENALQNDVDESYRKLAEARDGLVKESVRCSIVYDGAGADPATVPASTEVVRGEHYVIASVPPVKSGHDFIGWQSDDGALYQPGSTIVVNTSAILTAQFRQKNNPSTVQVMFQPQGGTPFPAAISVKVGAHYGNLPTVTRANYRFQGWFTSASGGSPVLADTVVSSAMSHTLYARWTRLNTSQGNGSGSSVSHSPQPGSSQPEDGAINLVSVDDAQIPQGQPATGSSRTTYMPLSAAVLLLMAALGIFRYAKHKNKL